MGNFFGFGHAAQWHFAHGLCHGFLGVNAFESGICGHAFLQAVGQRQAMIDVMGGTIPLVYTALAGAISHVKAGKLHAVAVSSAQRAPPMPDVPTFIESGVADFDINSWVGLLAPAKTPRAIVDKLNTELNAVLNDPAVHERLNALGITASPGGPERFGRDMARDLARYAGVVKAANLKVE